PPPPPCFGRDARCPSAAAPPWCREFHRRWASRLAPSSWSLGDPGRAAVALAVEIVCCDFHSRLVRREFAGRHPEQHPGEARERGHLLASHGDVSVLVLAL